MRLNKVVIVGLSWLLFLWFVGTLIFMGMRDHKAEDRCHQLGGQTWDSGQHCTVGGKTVNTR